MLCTLMLLAAVFCAMYSVGTEARDLDVYFSYSIDINSKDMLSVAECFMYQ